MTNKKKTIASKKKKPQSSIGKYLDSLSKEPQEKEKPTPKKGK